MGVLSKGITLSYKGSAQGATYTTLTNLQEIPDIGNTAPDKIDITVLTDNAKKSMAGLQDSSQDLVFKFLFEATQFDSLAGLSGSYNWKVELPDDNGTATFTGTPSVKLNGVGVNNALTYSLTITVESLIEFD